MPSGAVVDDDGVPLATPHEQAMLAAAGADGLLWRIVRSGGIVSGYADAAAMPAPAVWAAQVYLDAEERRAAEYRRRARRER